MFVSGCKYREKPDFSMPGDSFDSATSVYETKNNSDLINISTQSSATDKIRDDEKYFYDLVDEMVIIPPLDEWHDEHFISNDTHSRDYSLETGMYEDGNLYLENGSAFYRKGTGVGYGIFNNNSL